MNMAEVQPVQVAVTGGDGRIATLLRERLPARFTGRWLSRADADVTDLVALERAFAGAGAVVHLAANADADAPWEDVHAINVSGTYNVFEAARRAEVSRVVFASSNHAMGMYLHDDARFADPTAPVLVGADAPVRPDSLYGASKVWGEALGRMYSERYGMRVVCLRIGWVPDDDAPPSPTALPGEPPDVARRAPAMWLSHRDCADLIIAALGAEVPFAIVNGVSDNGGRWFTLDEGRELLGWYPQDGFA